MNRRSWLFSLFISLIAATSILADARVPFSREGILDARKKATEEKKLVFIHFYASWCAPCKWMEQTTFQEKEVVQTLDSQFVSIQVDIDAPENKNFRNLYAVKYLPTMLVMNADGEILSRVEETLSPRKLLEILHSFQDKARWTTEKKEMNSAPVPNESDQYFHGGENFHPVYRLQVGFFSQYDGAADFVSLLRSRFSYPVLVMSEIKEERMYYRVFLGQFAQQVEADALRHQLQEEHKMSGIVRTL